jgi:uncharacterized protein YhjY with autotransporter beta-barrel domain
VLTASAQSPAAVAIAATTTLNAPVTVDLAAKLTAGFSSIAISTNPSHGTAQIAGSKILYTPNARFSGTDSFAYTVTGAGGTSSPATISVTVSPRVDPSSLPEVKGQVGAQATAARGFGQAQLGNFQHRLESLHDDPGGNLFSNGISVRYDGRSLGSRSDLAPQDAALAGSRPGIFDGRTFAGPSEASLDEALRAARRPMGADPSQPQAPAADLPQEPRGTPSAPSQSPLRIWTGGAIGFGSNNAANQAARDKYSNQGLSIGADYRIDETLTIGVGGGFGQDNSEIGDDGSRIVSRSYSVSAYASYQPFRHIFIDGLAGYGTMIFDSRRVAGDGSYISGRRDGRQGFGSLSAGYEYREDGFLVSPYGRIDILDMRLDPFTETGGSSDSLTYFRQTATTLTGSAGLRASYAETFGWGAAQPFVRIEYHHDFSGGEAAGMAYADEAASGPTAWVPGTASEANRVELGLGGRISIDTLTLSAEYDSTFGMAGQRDNSIRLTGSKRF